MLQGVKPAFAVLILAAGQGRRMGRTKAMAPWCEGTLLDDAIHRARQLGLPVQVMVGAGYPLVRFRCAAVPSRWCLVPDWSEGMAAALREGLARMPVNLAGTLVMAVDQPLVPVSHLELLLERAREHPQRPVATDADGCAMVPAYLPKATWHELRGVQGDAGARQLLRSRGAAVERCREAAMDLDTWEALRRADPEVISRADHPARQCLRRICPG